MRFVVDVNVIISALIKKGVSFKVFALNSILKKFRFFAPEFLLTEFKKHEKEILKESELARDVFLETIELIFEQIEIVPAKEFKNFVQKAQEILQTHSKDIPYLALALALNCGIFSGDKKLKELIPEKVYSPRDLLDILLKK